MTRNQTAWPGGKEGAGIYQRLINQIPRHDEYIAPFAGCDTIARFKRPASRTVLVDRDQVALERLDSALIDVEGVELFQTCGIAWLRSRFKLDRFSPAPLKPMAIDAQLCDVLLTSAFVYVDPPYPFSTRFEERTIYDYELTDADHRRLLETLLALPCACMVSCYPCDMYDDALSTWRRIEYLAPTRGKPKIEACWMNYAPPSVLHDTRYLGDNKRQRERIRRRVRNWTAGLAKLPPLERQAIIDAINDDSR